MVYMTRVVVGGKTRTNVQFNVRVLHSCIRNFPFPVGKWNGGSISTSGHRLKPFSFFFCESSYIVDTVVVVLAMCCTFAGDAATLLPVASQHVQGL